MKSRFHLSIALLGFALTASAATITWNGGAGDGIYQTGANWVGGSPPANADYGDTALFGTDGTPTTVTLSANRKVQNIRFNTVGWTINDNTFTDVRLIQSRSASAGTNVIGSQVNAYNSYTWTVDPGNTLRFTGSLYLRDKTITVAGGGIMEVDNGVNGYSSGTWGLNIGAAELQINNSGLFAGGTSSNTFIALTDDTAKFRFAGTVAQANDYITNGKILNQTTQAALQATDIGGGYTEIVAVPEPGALHLALIAFAGLGLAWYRRT